MRKIDTMIRRVLMQIGKEEVATTAGSMIIDVARFVYPSLAG